MAYKNIEDRRKYDKEYYLENKDRKEKYRKIYYIKNREEICRKFREKYIPKERILKTKEELNESERKWRIANRDKINANQKEWRDKNRNHLLSYRREYYNNRLSLGIQYGRLRASAKERDYEVSLNFEDFKGLVLKKCYYCGEVEKRRGIDRLNNKKGYTKDNSVSCCKVCNYMKRSLTKEEFLRHVAKIHNFQR